MKKIILMTAILGVILSVPALAADQEYKSETNVSRDSNGDVNSDSTNTSTDSSGTTTTNESKKSVDTDSNGDYKKESETTTKVKPKGIFSSSSKTSTKNVVKKKGHKVTTKHTKKVNGDTTEDTQMESDTSGQ